MRRDKPRPYGEGSVLSFAPRALVQAAPFFGELQVTLGVAERPLFQKAAEPCLPDRGDVTLHRLRDKEAPVSLFRDPKKGDRSFLISEAVQRYVTSIGKTRLRRLLKEGSLRHAERDLKLAEEWCSLDESPWRERQD